MLLLSSLYSHSPSLGCQSLGRSHRPGAPTSVPSKCAYRHSFRFGRGGLTVYTCYE